MIGQKGNEEYGAPHRCSFCAKYPADIKKGCHTMMGGQTVKASICR
jgi:hypothetical protein